MVPGIFRFSNLLWTYVCLLICIFLSYCCELDIVLNQLTITFKNACPTGGRLATSSVHHHSSWSLGDANRCTVSELSCTVSAVASCLAYELITDTNGPEIKIKTKTPQMSCQMPSHVRDDHLRLCSPISVPPLTVWTSWGMTFACRRGQFVELVEIGLQLLP